MNKPINKDDIPIISLEKAFDKNSLKKWGIPSLKKFENTIICDVNVFNIKHGYQLKINRGESNCEGYLINPMQKEVVTVFGESFSDCNVYKNLIEESIKWLETHHGKGKYRESFPDANEIKDEFDLRRLIFWSDYGNIEITEDIRDKIFFGVFTGSDKDITEQSDEIRVKVRSCNSFEECYNKLIDKAVDWIAENKEIFPEFKR